MKQAVIITGAGIGIGRATAIAFGKAGFHVAVTDVLEEQGRKVAADIAASGGSAAFHKLDVTSTEEVGRAMLRVVRERPGRPILEARDIAALGRGEALP